VEHQTAIADSAINRLYCSDNPLLVALLVSFLAVEVGRPNVTHLS